LQKRGVDYIVLCKNSAEARFLAIRAAEQYRTPNSLVQALLDEKPPAGIRLVEGDAPLLLYALE
jgi:hypothetical protein